jgi:hypothetical protein
LFDAPVVVGRDTEQDVFQIREWRDVGELAALHERIKQRGAASTLEAAGE